MQNIPLRIYSGNITGAAALLSLLFQLFRLIVVLSFAQAAHMADIHQLAEKMMPAKWYMPKVK